MQLFVRSVEGTTSDPTQPHHSVSHKSYLIIQFTWLLLTALDQATH